MLKKIIISMALIFTVCFMFDNYGEAVTVTPEQQEAIDSVLNKKLIDTTDVNSFIIITKLKDQNFLVNLHVLNKDGTSKIIKCLGKLIASYKAGEFFAFDVEYSSCDGKQANNGQMCMSFLIMSKDMIKTVMYRIIRQPFTPVEIWATKEKLTSGTGGADGAEE